MKSNYIKLKRHLKLILKLSKTLITLTHLFLYLLKSLS
jgi:hypothetical protein